MKYFIIPKKYLTQEMIDILNESSRSKYKLDTFKERTFLLWAIEDKFIAKFIKLLSKFDMFPNSIETCVSVRNMYGI